METQTTETAASSPAPLPTFDAPSDPAANLEWRQGKTPETKMPKADSTPAKEPASTAAPATASKQEKETKSAAAIRLDEILADLKTAGLSPDELKTFKREAKTAATESAKAVPEKTANPQDLTAPEKPDTSQMTWEEAEAAKDAYREKYAEYVAAKAVREDRQARAEEAQGQRLAAKVTEAKARYGEQTEATIGEATRVIMDEKSGVHPIVKVMLGESDVLVDVMYVLGSKPEELASFVALAKANPGAALRKVALMEHLIQQELGGAKSEAAAAGATGATERGADGKFVSTTPAKSKPAAPPPPEELSTRGSAPPNPMDAAFRASEASGDSRTFIDAENRRLLAERKGR